MHTAFLENTLLRKRNRQTGHCFEALPLYFSGHKFKHSFQNALTVVPLVSTPQCLFNL